MNKVDKLKIKAGALIVSVMMLIIIVGVNATVTFTDNNITDSTYGKIIDFDDNYIDISNISIDNNITINDLTITNNTITSDADYVYADGTFDFVNSTVMAYLGNFTARCKGIDNWCMIDNFDNGIGKWKDFAYSGGMNSSDVNFSGCSGGGKSIRLDVPANGRSYVYFTFPVCWDYALGGIRFRFDIMIDDVSEVNGFQNRIMVRDSSGNKFVGYSIYNNINSFSDNVWKTIDIEARTYVTEGLTTGKKYCTDMHDIMISTYSSGKAGFNLYMDNLEISPPLFPNGVITFTWADQSKSQYDVYKIMKGFGMRCNAAIAFENGGARFNASELKEMQDYGWDFLNHRWDHLSELSHSFDDIKLDIIKQRSQMENLGIDYPWLGNTPPGGNLVYKWLNSKYGCFVLNGTYVDDYNNFPPKDNFYGWKNLINTTNLATVQSWVNIASSGLWLNIDCHGIDGDGYSPISSELLRQICEYIYNKGIPVMTFSELYNTITNYVLTERSGNVSIIGTGSKFTFEVYHLLDAIPNTIIITPNNITMANCTYWISGKTPYSFNITIYERGDWSALDTSDRVSFNWLARLD